MIAATMHRMGFLRTEKTYIPHITVGRDVRFKEEYIVEGNNNGMFKGKIPEILVKNFSLIESRIADGKRVYKTLAKFDFKLSEKQDDSL
ncbi:RNA 2',3'-cyclic phosphodiesterase [bioreactor metagenome]|uniref:RNA 2',3'-cyclic phosphodiesterase n=1 Tax=bioreactor metagenome TaxID=1076179 RepID=A0A645EGH2_9ZZZZ